MGRKATQRLVAAILLAFAAPFLSAQTNSEQADSLVRLLNASFIEQYEAPGGEAVRKAVQATFLHNGTYLSCDSSLWYTERKIINCLGNVSLTQGDTQLTSEKLDYLIDEDLAQFRGGVVQLTNDNDNILRTRILDYNTRDSLAIFKGGAAMRSAEGQIIESDDGSYNSKTKLFNFRGKVSMYTDSTFVRTTILDYDSDPQIATFPEYVDFWRSDNMLSASKGWYDRAKELFFFTGKVHGQSPTQESWSDSLYYYRSTNDVLMLGAAQVQDSTRNFATLSEYLFYEDSLSRATLRTNVAVASWSERNGQIDTSYFGADTLIYQGIRRCDIPESTVQLSQKRRSDFAGDPVAEFRRRAAEEAAQEQEEQQKAARPNAPKPKTPEPSDNPEPEAPSSAEPQAASSKEAAATQAATNPEAAADSLSSAAGKTAQSDSLSIQGGGLRDGLSLSGTQRDSLLANSDSLGFQLDSLAAALDSLALLPPPDTSRVGFIRGIGDVKVFRSDMQLRCDSLSFCELDSIALLYKSPIVWNEGRRQYRSDSLFVLMGKEGIEKANLISNAFITVQEDSTYYDQIRSLEVMAYFDSDSNLSRFDALGGVSALFYLWEGEEGQKAIATVNKVESKMLSATMKDGELERAYYFQSPKNDAYPVVQLPSKDHTLKGYSWEPDQRPKSRYDISTLELRQSERSHYNARPQAAFPLTDLFFPGYMNELKSGLAAQKERKRIARARRDSLEVQIDTSLIISADSLALSERQLDSASLAPKSQSDSLQVSPGADPEPGEEMMSDAELRRAMRIARRDARWSELDKRDAERAAAREAKREARRKRREERASARKARQEARDEALLQRYIDYYQKRKDKDEQRQAKVKPSRQRIQGIEGGRDLRAAFEREE